MYRSILVPLDGSSFAEHALPVALSLARRCRARLVMVTVSTPLAEAYVEGMYLSTSELEHQVRERYEAYLTSTANDLRRRCSLDVVTAVLHGEIAGSLCDFLARGEADFVVMATHGRGPMGRFWLGSVADEMIRHAHAPLLLVRPGTGPVDLGTEPELGRIVLPLDGTPLAEQVLRPAMALASVLPGAECVLMQAIHSVVPVGMAPEGGQAEKEARTILRQVMAVQEQLRQRAERYLEGVAQRFREKGLRARVEVVVEDNPALAILHEAEKEHATLIALQTHGRRGLSRLVMGSVADKVIRGTHVPVLVQRPNPG